MLRITIYSWFFILNARIRVDLMNMNFIQNMVELLQKGVRSYMFFFLAQLDNQRILFI